jgi:hypothetical protein
MHITGSTTKSVSMLYHIEIWAVSVSIREER